MNMKDYVRDASKVHACIHEDDATLIVKKPFKVYIPTRFQDKNLAVVGNETYILGVYLIISDDKYYAVELTTALMQIEPSSINTVDLDGKEMFEFVFEAGDTFVTNIELLQNAKLLYYIFEELIGKGNVPPYMNYVDALRTFQTAEKHAGTRLASTPTILELLISMICRDPKAPMTYFRQITDGKDLQNLLYVPLRSSIFGATNAVAKLLGPNFNDSLTSLLVNDVEEVEDVENILLR
jgi:hypothetical protein